MSAIRLRVEDWLPVCAGLWLLVVSALARAEEWIYTVRPDDTLWELSEEYLARPGDWRRLQEYNHIPDPLHLAPGIRLRIPITWLKSQPASAKVLHVRGQARRISADGASPRQLVAGEELRIGDRVRTDANSSATIEFADGSQFLLHAESELHFDALSAYGRTGMVDTQMRLQQGRGESRVVPRGGAGSRYQITTPSAVAAVRGTAFRLNAAETTTRGEVIEGRIGFSAAGVTRDVPAGFGIVAEAGKPPAPPQRLLPAPNVLKLPRLVQRAGVSFSWPAVKGGVAYRVQLFAGIDYQVLLEDEEVKAAQFALAELTEEGDYGLRLRTIDDAGLEGLNAEHTFVFKRPPEPPQPVTLGSIVLTGARLPDLRWEPGGEAASFHVQVATDAEFTDLIVDSSSERSPAMPLPPELEPGRYFWRVAARSPGGVEGPFSNSASFLAVRRSPPPTGLAVVFEGEQLVFSWQPVADAERYQLQLSAQEDFLEPLAERTTEQTEIAFPRPDPGIVYYRARSVGPGPENLGPFGASERIVVPQATYWPYLLLPVLPFLL
jgi:hypothetical protein